MIQEIPPHRNQVERLIQEAESGAMEAEEFARRLLVEQVFMPVRDDRHKIAGFQTSTRAEPLVVDDEEGNRILLLFTAPERAKEVLVDHPDYGGGLVTEFSWILRRVGPEMGISINPGDEPGFDFDAEMVAMMASLLPEEAQ
jgi:hypothetical protein